MTQKTIEQKYKKLTEVEHVLTRPGRYIGSISSHTESIFVYDVDKKMMVKRETTFNPGFQKLFDEIISNSVDHSKRQEGKHLDSIRVDIDTIGGSICVHDNGGIPVVKHSDHDQWIPEMIFELRAGSNFDDSDETMVTGQNGEGAGLTLIFSKKFIIETCDGKNKFKMTWENNSKVKHEPKITSADGQKGYTKITYYPDFEKLGTSFDDGNQAVLLKRVIDVAGLNTHLKVYWNGARIPTRTFKDYIEMYTGSDVDCAYDETENWKVAVASSDDGFQHVSFVNGTNTKIGGTHILYAGMQIWERIREYIKKKHKVDVKPSELRQHMILFIDCSIVNPRYSSQTKDDLITEVKDYKTSWSVSDKMINKIIKSTIIQDILDWAMAKQAAQDAKDARDAQKDINKSNPKRVDKFTDALEKVNRHRCILLSTEGDSARRSVQNARGKNPFIGSFSLRGKPRNVTGISDKEVLENNEMKNILTITGLTIGERVDNEGEWIMYKMSNGNQLLNINDIIIGDVDIFVKDHPSNFVKRNVEPTIEQLDAYQAIIGSSIVRNTGLRFGKIISLTDQDLDGAHISSLLINFFAKYWPELFSIGVIGFMKTPLIIATEKKKQHEFFLESDYKNWAATAGKHEFEYFKGLGQFSTNQFEVFINNLQKYIMMYDSVKFDDTMSLTLAFDDEADMRKEWLNEETYFKFYD